MSNQAFQYDQIMLALQAAQEAAQRGADAPPPPLTAFRLLVGSVLLLLAVAALVTNSFVLGMFGWSVGQDEWEKPVLLAAGVLSPILLATLHPTFVLTWRPGHWLVDHRGKPKWRRGRPSWGLLLALTLLSLVSLTLNFAGGIGVMSKARKAVEIKADDAIDESKRLRERIAMTKGELDAIQPHRPAEAVTSFLASHKLHPFWKATNGCAEVLNRSQRNYCAEYGKLEAEQKSAEQAGRLRATLAQLDEKLANPLRADIAASGAPVDAIAANTGMSRETVQARLALLFPLFLELMVIVPMWASMVAFRIDHRAMQDIPHGGFSERPQPASRQLPAPVQEAPTPLTVIDVPAPRQEPPRDMPRFMSNAHTVSDDGVRKRAVLAEFWSTRVRRIEGQQISLPALYQHYVAHASQRGVREYDMSSFEDLSREHMAGATEINGLVWVYGVTLEG